MERSATSRSPAARGTRCVLIGAACGSALPVTERAGCCGVDSKHRVRAFAAPPRPGLARRRSLPTRAAISGSPPHRGGTSNLARRTPDGRVTTYPYCVATSTGSARLHRCSSTDAGAGPSPIARQQTLAPRPERPPQAGLPGRSRPRLAFAKVVGDVSRQAPGAPAPLLLGRHGAPAPLLLGRHDSASFESPVGTCLAHGFLLDNRAPERDGSTRRGRAQGKGA